MYKRGKGWAIGYKDEHGKTVQRATSARTKTEAQRLADELEARAERVRLGLEAPHRADIPFKEAAARYLAALPPEYRSKADLEGRLRVRVLPHLGDVMVRRMTPADVQAMLAANADASPQTREHLRIAVQGCYTWLIEAAELAEVNPARAVPRVRIPRREPLYLKREDIPRLLEAMPPQWLPATLTALGTALRKGELLALTKRGWLREECVLVVGASHESATTKSGRERRVPVPGWLVPVLDAQLATPGRLLFPNPQGKRWSRKVRLHDVVRRALIRAGLVEGWTLVCRRKGCGFKEDREAREDGARCPRCDFKLWPVGKPIPFRWKDLRSTWATYAAAATGDIRFVQKVLGHGSPLVTEQRYAHALPGHFAAQAARVDLGLGLVSRVSVTGDETGPKLTTGDEPGDAQP